MARRRHGEGTIYPWRDGWRGEIEVPRLDGRRRRKVVLGTTRQEVQEKLVATLHAHNRRTLPSGKTRYVGEFLTSWLARRVDLEDGTRKSYRIKLDHVIRRFGSKRLRDLTAEELDTFFAVKRRSPEHPHGLAPQCCLQTGS